MIDIFLFLSIVPSPLLKYNEKLYHLLNMYMIIT